MANLIFDYDGTLHDCIKIYAPAFRLAYSYLVSLGVADKREWSVGEISRWLGFSAKDMWNSFMPELPKSLKEECSKIIGDEMIHLVAEGKAQLYPHTLKVLKKLKDDGHTLIFLSNCKHSYMDAHINQFHLNNYFSGFYCSEDFDFKEKYKIFKNIKREYKGEFIVIGDRFQDMEIGEKHGVKAIGCSYGYGDLDELKYAERIAFKISDIPRCI